MFSLSIIQIFKYIPVYFFYLLNKPQYKIVVNEGYISMKYINVLDNSDYV
jgi:hypothetical protein